MRATHFALLSRMIKSRKIRCPTYKRGNSKPRSKENIGTTGVGGRKKVYNELQGSRVS